MEALQILLDAEYYQKPDFWIFIVIGALGLIFSFASWVQATGAKNAAKEAGKTVKFQDIISDIDEINNLCTLEINVKFEQANDILSKIISKTSSVIGLIKEITHPPVHRVYIGGLLNSKNKQRTENSSKSA